MKLIQYKDDPNTLRKEVLSQRKKVSLENRQQKFAKVCKKLYKMDEFQRSNSILGYYGKTISGEFDTLPLLLNILKNGKTLSLPRCVPNKTLLEAYRITDLNNQLSLGSYDIMEPLPEKTRLLTVSAIDIVLVPGSVFDKHGGRYGYGAGYYDSFLANFHGLKIALALDFTVMDFPLLLHEKDVIMDLIITESNIYRRN